MASGDRISLQFRRALRNRFQSTRHYPIPREPTPYAYAKIAEYVDRDLRMAEAYYRQAIAQGERMESALKDLAGVLHQQGKTEEACELLKTNRHIFMSDLTKYENLLANLQRQVFPSVNTFNKSVKINGLGRLADELTVRTMFGNSSRILGIDIDQEEGNRFAVLTFASHSAARKTIDTYQCIAEHRMQWISVDGEVSAEVCLKKDEPFSLFSDGRQQELPNFVLFYRYLPEHEVEEKGGFIDRLLDSTILSYFKK